MGYYDNLWWLLTDLVGIFRNGVEILRDIAKIVWTSAKYHRNNMKTIWNIVKICDVVNILWTSSHRSSHRCENHREITKTFVSLGKAWFTPVWTLRENSVRTPWGRRRVRIMWNDAKYCENMNYCGNDVRISGNTAK